jgi:hypothetical protein
MSTLAGFRGELQALINSHSMENGSDTPDFILAEFLTDCLAAFDKTVKERTRWYNGAAGPTPGAFVDRNLLPENDDAE